ncbi:MAG: hypothetical protein R3Y26_05250 [Rikenellaceae bacterium]
MDYSNDKTSQRKDGTSSLPSDMLIDSSDKTYALDPAKSIKQNLLDFSSKKKILETDNEKIKKQQKAIAVGDFVSLLGKSIGAWGGVKPTTSSPSYFAKLEEQREKNRQMYDALDLQERNLKLSDYYNTETQKQKQAALKQQEEEKKLSREYELEAEKRKRQYQLEDAQTNFNNKVILQNIENEYKSKEADKNRQIDWGKIDASKNKSTSSKSTLIIQDEVTGEDITVPQSFVNSALAEILKDPNSINTLKSYKEDLSQSVADKVLDLMVAKKYQNHLKSITKK